MKIFVLLAVLFLAVVAADPCGNLNAIYEQKISPYYRQFIEDFQVVDTNTLLVAQSYDISTSPKELKFLGTRLVSLNSIDRSELTLISQAYFNSSGPLSETAMITNGTLIFGVSNAVKVTFANTDVQEKNILRLGDALQEQRRSAVSFLVPTTENAALSNVYFLALNATTPNPLSGVDKDLDVIPFTYPFAQGVEKIYDVNGAVVADQTIDYSSSAVHTDLTNKYQLQVRALNNVASSPAASNDILGTFSFVALVTTQGSTKLVKYTATINPFNNNIMKKSVQTSATLVVPAVSGYNGTTGGVLFATPNNNIFVVAHVHKNQLAAFNALHKLALVIPEKQVQVPILLTYDPITLTRTDARVLGSALDAANLFATAMDARDNNALIIAGNTVAPNTQQRTAADNQRAFVIRLSLNASVGLTESAQTLLSVIVTDADKKQFGADARFLLKSAAVAIGSDDAGRVVVGGWVGDYVSALMLGGRVSLVDISSGNAATLLYSMDVGESGSNAVELIRRQFASANVAETLFLGMMMDAPTQSVADNAYRNVGSGFWQIDCSPRNNALELGVKIAFFAFFGVVAVIFTAVVGFYGFMCIKMAVEKRRGTGYNNIN